jgi:hypothetical protein
VSRGRSGRIAVGIPDNLSVEETLARDALPRR